MKPLDLLDSAEDLLKGSSRPRQANLRRAQSSIYYAMFHCLCKMTADTLVGGPGSNSSNKAWQQAYRAVDHGTTKNACKQQSIINRFPVSIQDFANSFCSAQEKRHKADYDPNVQLGKSEVKAEINWTRQVISNFTSSPIKDRRAFCTYLVFKIRKN